MELSKWQEAFRGKTVFLTGHTGFKGTWLLTVLAQMGAKVVGYSLEPNTSPSIYQQVAKDIEHQSIIADINNAEALANEVMHCQPDFIFHLAAQPLVRYSYLEPIDTFTTNIIGTANVLNALRNLQKPCVCICITTDKVYHNHEWEYPYRENDSLGGYDPYSASKAAAELVINSYRNSYFHPQKHSEHGKTIVSVRAGNVIGGGDWSANRLIPDVVSALHECKPVIIRSPNAVRPWQHVLEPVFGYLQLAIAAKNSPVLFGGAWNFGPDLSDNLSVLEIVQKSIEVWGAGTVDIQQSADNPHEAGLLQLDISKVKRTLGWRPKLNTQQALERTIDWYKHWYQGKSPLELINNDINFYKTLM